jgi:nicotinamide mononucleotide (NMN) deamidase PncC
MARIGVATAVAVAMAGVLSQTGSSAQQPAGDAAIAAI